MTEDDEAIEHTLTQIAQAHLYSLPPGPRPAGGYRCQDWPKSSHIFTGRVRVVATGPKCTIRIEDKEKGTLFAMCPLSNDNLETSVEPVSDSSRYFVLRVADVTTGRHAFIGMGFVDRNEAFDFNVTLQDHIKHVRYEAEAAKRATYRESLLFAKNQPQRESTGSPSKRRLVIIEFICTENSYAVSYTHLTLPTN